jgi:flavin reductase (DIM6/NTAB) family NADH-FMN oxidoreductase RutF/DNA-binding FadR family transcriptional regulator
MARAGQHHDAPTRRTTAQTFRDVVGRFATGVTIVTTRHDGRDYGLTASAFSSLSLEPPMLLVCINLASPTGDAIHRSGIFTVSVLAEDQARLAQRFATRHADKFAGVETSRGALGTIMLAGALAYIDCHVAEDVVAGTHRIFIGAVQHAVGREGAPLAYFRGQFGQVHLPQHDPVYAMLRAEVLAADHADLSPTALAARTGASRDRIDRALAQLAREGLLSGDPVNGYRVASVTSQAVTDALDARCAIELGAAELSVGRTTPADVTDLRRRAEHIAPLVAGGPAADIEAYARANTAFHEALVGLAGSSALLDAYRSLGLPGILVRGVGRSPALTSAVNDDHRAIVRAYQEGDLAAARAAIIGHTDRAKAIHAAALG